jgi:Na+/proline symporter
MIGSLKLHYVDIAIIATYLLVCVVVGLLKFDKIKTLRDYTLGVKPFSYFQQYLLLQ